MTFLILVVAGLSLTTFVAGGVIGYLRCEDTRSGVKTGAIIGVVLGLLVIVPMALEAKWTFDALNQKAGDGTGAQWNFPWFEFVVLPLAWVFLQSVGTGAVGGGFGSAVAENKRRSTNS